MLSSRGNPGIFDVQITIEQPTSAVNSIGENEKTWSVYKTAYAKREWKRSLEKYEAKELVSSDSAWYRMVYDGGMNTTMRFKQNGDTSYFYILDIQHWQREGYTFLVGIRRDNQ